jgi:hypothetical protein
VCCDDTYRCLTCAGSWWRGRSFASMCLQVLACLWIVKANDNFQPPPEQTRCMSCAFRNEERGYFIVEREPTIISRPDGLGASLDWGDEGSVQKPLLEEAKGEMLLGHEEEGAV